MGDTVKVAAILTTSGNVRDAYFGNSSGQVYKFRTGNNDNTVAIPFKWTSMQYTSNAPQLLKDYKYLYVYLERTAKPGIDVFYSVDFDDFKPLGTAHKTVSEFVFPSGISGNSIRIQFAQNSTTDQQNIYGFVCLGDIEAGRLQDVE